MATSGLVYASHKIRQNQQESMVMFLPMAEQAIWQSGRIGKVKQTGRWQSESEAPGSSLFPAALHTQGRVADSKQGNTRNALYLFQVQHSVVNVWVLGQNAKCSFGSCLHARSSWIQPPLRKLMSQCHIFFPYMWCGEVTIKISTYFFVFGFRCEN